MSNDALSLNISLILRTISSSRDDLTIPFTVSMMALASLGDLRVNSRSQFLPPDIPKKLATDATSWPPVPM